MLSVVLGKETRGQDINLNQHKAGYYRPNKVWILDRMYVTELGKTINRTRTIWILDKFIFASLLRIVSLKKTSAQTQIFKPNRHSTFCSTPRLARYTARFISSICHLGGRVANTKPLILFRFFSAMRSTLSYPRSAQAYSSWNRDDLGVVICWCFDGWSYMK